jgi:hypothetical protein
MATEGSAKGFFAIFLVIVVVVAITYRDQTLFIFRFLWDLLVIHISPFLENMSKH